MVWIFASLSVARAAPVGFEPVRERDGCVIAMRPAAAGAPAAMRAECAWPDVSPDSLLQLLGDFERYPELVFPIDEARVVRSEAGRSLVYQRQAMVGIADREVLLWMTLRAEAGGATVAWTEASEEPLSLRPGAVRTPRNTGRWTFAPNGAGGSRVVHEIELDAGGSIPEWIVDLVRTHSFSKIMSDVRSAARSVSASGSAG